MIKVSKKQLSSLYFLYGKDEFLLHESEKKIIQASLSAEEKELNLAIYDMDETPVQVAVEDAETLPFFGERRVVIIRNPYFLTAEKKKEKLEHNIQVLEQYIQTPSPFTIVIIVAPYEKLDERKKIVKALKKQAVLYEAKPMQERDMIHWVEDKLSHNNIQAEKQALSLLLEMTGGDMALIANEVDKLSLYLGEQGILTSSIVKQLVARTLEQDIFTLINEVVHLRLPHALEIFYDLLRRNEKPFIILLMIAGQFRLIFQVKTLAKAGYGQAQIASKLRVHPFRVKLAAEQSHQFSEQQLQQIIQHLAEADYNMKTGAMDEQVIVELFLMKLANRSAVS
ncbi:DNA polymerase III subunit delta [Bacillus sp. HMF5848]|uniref:DNA polymerase III subunit delta n=1 Tax=Bacillus sp. HMF5848 TaxID=2495421 RepID=UPI000F7B8E47|nr:DNA polymerase III subunit delta [Bacillus sp. HMF5848]RSK27912.1 DNA polymerase III subunit delta [Bacillus sp. HMF5848]